MTELPQPLTPADCDLRGMHFMPLDVNRLLDSDMFAEVTGDEFKAAVALWCKSWTQIPAGSLPNKDKVLAELSRAKNWKRVKAAAMRGWILCSDDRWYHPVMAEKALNALPSREEFNSKKSAEAERKARERDDRKALFELLKSYGVVPEWNVSTKVLRGMAAQYQSQDLLAHVTGDERDISQHVTVCKGEGEGEGEEREREKLTADDGDDDTIHDHGHTPGVAPLPPLETSQTSNDPAIVLTVALRKLGVDATAMHPTVIDWAQRKVPMTLLEQAIAMARESKPAPAKIPPNYLAPILHDLEHPPTGKVMQAPQKGDPGHWSTSAKGIESMGQSMGMQQAPGELVRDYGIRIQREIEKRKGQP